MNYINYKQGHKIPEELVIKILEDMGCENIKNNDYNLKSINQDKKVIHIDSKTRLIPDFICYKNQETILVEVGDLINGESKINLLLNNFDKIIHIFPDKDYFLIHSVIYEKKKKLQEKIKKIIKEQLKLIEDIDDGN